MRRTPSIKLVTAGGVEIPAKLFEKFEDDDVAFLAVDDPSALPPALPVAATDSRLGGEVFTIGYPHPELMGTARALFIGRFTVPQ